MKLVPTTACAPFEGGIARSQVEEVMILTVGNYGDDLERYFSTWIRDFHDLANSRFFIHGNMLDPSDHAGDYRDG